MTLIDQKEHNGHPVGRYRCSCGLVKWAVSSEVESGAVQSCGHSRSKLSYDELVKFMNEETNKAPDRLLSDRG